MIQRTTWDWNNLSLSMQLRHIGEMSTSSRPRRANVFTSVPPHRCRDLLRPVRELPVRGQVPAELRRDERDGRSIRRWSATRPPRRTSTRATRSRARTTCSAAMYTLQLNMHVLAASAATDGGLRPAVLFEELPSVQIGYADRHVPAQIEQLVEQAGRIGELRALGRRRAGLARNSQARPAASAGAVQPRRARAEARRRQVAHTSCCRPHARSCRRDLLVLMTLCAACQHLGDAEGEREAIEAALTQSTRIFFRRCSRRAAGSSASARSAGAAATFANALKVAPPPTHWPANLRAQLEHAREVVDRHAEAFDAFLNRELGRSAGTACRRRSPSAGARRPRSWRASRSRIGRESNQLCVPRLPAVPFFERAQFPFLAALEAKTDVIRAELNAALETDRDRFTPYIQYRRRSSP